jgi:hypothetical protein
MKNINDMVKSLNVTYNNRINSIKGDDDSISLTFEEDDVTKEENKNMDKIENLNKKISEIINLPMLKDKNVSYDTKLKMLNNLTKFSSSFYKTEFESLCPNDFLSFDKKICEIICGIGAKSLSDIIFGFTKCDTESLKNEFFDKNDLIDIIDRMFVPLYVVQKGSSKKSKIKLTKPAMIPEKYEILLENFYKIEIDICSIKESTSLNIFGFFESDCINSNIRTSQLSNKYLYEKKKELVELIKNTEKINSYRFRVS